jgi:hypothetical protein
MNKKIKKILIIILLLILGYFILDYTLYRAGEYFFKKDIINAEEVIGKTDNNPYGIRNDVYDVIQKEYVEKMKLNDEQKTLLYNIAYIDQKLISNFTDHSNILKYTEIQFKLVDCISEESIDLLNRLKSTDIYFRSLVNTKARSQAIDITELVFSQNQLEINQNATPEECALFKTKQIKAE